MKKPHTTVIACGGIKAELEKLQPAKHGIRMHYMPQNLHRTPDKLSERLQETIKKLSGNGGRIVLGYGLCCNGVVGLEAPEEGLYIPRVHDCIALYMGSLEKYKEIFSRQPGTYHLTRNWIENKKDPLGLVEDEYRKRVGEDMARETMEWEIKNYSHISYINTGSGKTKKFRERAQKNAQEFDKKYLEIPGDDAFFRQILFGPWDTKRFIYIKPHEISKQEYFLK